MPHGAVRAWTVTYAVRVLALKPRYAPHRPQTLKLQLGSARRPAQHVCRSRGATGASPPRRREAFQVGSAGPGYSSGARRLQIRQARPSTTRLGSNPAWCWTGGIECVNAVVGSCHRRDHQRGYSGESHNTLSLDTRITTRNHQKRSSTAHSHDSK